MFAYLRAVGLCSSSLRIWCTALASSIGLVALAPLSPAAAQWQEAGPYTSTNPLLDQPGNISTNTLVFGMPGQGDPVYGAMNSVLQSPSDPNTYWAATVGGGIWKTTNAGKTWTPTTDHQASLFTGTIALDTVDASGQTLYAGSAQ